MKRTKASLSISPECRKIKKKKEKKEEATRSLK